MELATSASRRTTRSNDRSAHKEPSERFLSIPEVAEVLGTSERFPRRLIEERRIEFKRFGRHVRIGESVLREYIESCTVTPATRRPARAWRLHRER